MNNIGILLSDGFEEIEALTVVDILRRAEVNCKIISVKEEYVKGSHGIIVKSDMLFKDVKTLDLVILPGGMPGASNLRDDEGVINLLKDMDREKKVIAAICAAPIALEKADIIRDRKITSYPKALENEEKIDYSEERVVVSENLITSRGPSTAMEFSYAILRKLGLDEKASILEKAMLYKKIR